MGRANVLLGRSADFRTAQSGPLGFEARGDDGDEGDNEESEGDKLKRRVVQKSLEETFVLPPCVGKELLQLSDPAVSCRYPRWIEAIPRSKQ